MKSVKRKPWGKEDVRELRALAKQGIRGRKIARRFKRTAGAIYQKAHHEGISLR